MLLSAPSANHVPMVGLTKWSARTFGQSLCLVVAGILAAASAQAAPTTAVTIAGGSVLSDADTNGWRFQALSSIKVTSLGAWDEGADGLPAQVDVGLWSDAGTLLASLTLGAGTTESLIDGFRFADLLTSVSLTAGDFYRVGASPKSGSLQYREGVTVVSSAEVGYIDGYYAGSSNALTFPGSPGNVPNYPDFFGANFRFETASVPEPSTIVLLGIALAALGATRRKSTAQG